MNSKVLKLRQILEEKEADAILINSADEFLSEYNILQNNSRYKITNFSGSTGDCVVTKDKIFQIVDGRYYQQADNEVNLDFVTVIKMQQGSSPIKEIVEILDSKSTLLITANKVSALFCEKLSEKSKEKDIKIKYLNIDPVDDEGQNTYTNVELQVVPTEIVHLSLKEKFRYFAKNLTDNQVLFVTVPTDFAYLTNLRNYDFPYSSAPRAKAIVTNKDLTIFTNSKIPYTFECLKIKRLQDFRKTITQILGKEIFADKNTLSQSDFMSIHSSNKILSTNVFDKKSEKFDSEITHLKSAFERTDRVLKKMNDLINSDIKLTEYDLFCAINRFFKEEGAFSQSFKPIIASGANSSIIHYSVSSPEKVINEGDFVMIDCGGYFEGGIATDITRTFIKGTPTEEQKYVYTKVFQSVVAAFTSDYTDKSTWQDIDLIARKKLVNEEKNGYYFSHSTGHGIGISVHEFPPRCSSQDSFAQPFKKNYVFSIEPGIYKKDVGGVRLENAVYAKSISPKLEIEALSHYPFEEKLIDRKLLTAEEIKFLEDWNNYGKTNNISGK
jgi:Xaa-Pro aminopeptidase